MDWLKHFEATVRAEFDKKKPEITKKLKEWIEDGIDHMPELKKSIGHLVDEANELLGHKKSK